MSILSLTATQLAKKIKDKEVTVKEAVEAVLKQIEEKDGEINAYVTVDREGALKRAEEIQTKIDNGEITGNLAGVPVAINVLKVDVKSILSFKDIAFMVFLRGVVVMTAF